VPPRLAVFSVADVSIVQLQHDVSLELVVQLLTEQSVTITTMTHFGHQLADIRQLIETLSNRVAATIKWHRLQQPSVTSVMTASNEQFDKFDNVVASRHEEQHHAADLDTLLRNSDTGCCLLTAGKDVTKTYAENHRSIHRSRLVTHPNIQKDHHWWNVEPAASGQRVVYVTRRSKQMAENCRTTGASKTNCCISVRVITARGHCGSSIWLLKRCELDRNELVYVMFSFKTLECKIKQECI